MRGVGVDAEWRTLQANDSFFAITKNIHNLLQGKQGRLSGEEFGHYLDCNQEAAEQLGPHLRPTDLLILHDPQDLPLRSYLRTPCPTVWVCHIDTTNPNEELRDLLMPYVRLCDLAVFSADAYVFPGLEAERVRVIPPAIDPMSPKNVALPMEEAKEVLAGLGIDPGRPLMTQVSRFDIWKDPWGVVDAYRMAKQSVPELQLALVGVFDAQDDAEAVEIFRTVRSYVGGTEDVHLYTDPKAVKVREVNAFQTASDVILQKSTREGFGLSVTEAMWKGTPVIGGDCGGIRLQIRDGENGFIADTAALCAERVVALLKDKALARRIGKAARESVSRRYLMPRLLKDYLDLAKALLPQPAAESGELTGGHEGVFAPALSLLPDPSPAADPLGP